MHLIFIINSENTISVHATVRVSFDVNITIDGENLELTDELIASGEFKNYRQAVIAEMSVIYPSIDENQMTITHINKAI